ncbi:ROK family transcriptional regulator [Streptomyces sp. NPDC056716]|uniref:ROK family transcriptional regulator n=1 Tax=unclassified Streptomyces TaxID=2593676 RepID=UPI0036CA0F32
MKADPSMVRAINRRSVIDAIQHHGVLSRSQVARVVGLSKPTVSEVFTDLLAAGLLREAGATHGKQGPKALLYEINSEAAWVVGIDVGRRWIRAALADLSGRMIARHDERVRLRSNQSLLDQIGAMARTVMAERAVGWDQVSQVTVGSPGVVDPARGQMMLAANLPGWERQGMVESIRARFDAAVAIENDVNLAALGELWSGYGRQYDNFAYLWIGSGVGLGLVIDGKLHRGARGLAGEIGYLPIGLEGTGESGPPWRGWFSSGTVEQAVARLAAARGLDRSPTMRSVFAMARRGDALAREVVELEARLLARAVSTVAAVVDPEVVVLGGGIGHNGDLLTPAIEATLRSLTPLSVQVVNSMLGTDAVLHGAVGSAVSDAWGRLLGTPMPEPGPRRRPIPTTDATGRVGE